jgi:hypothetical protein
MVYVLTSILDSEDTIIVAVLGIIYATIRSAALFQHFTITQMAWAGDRQSLEQRLEGDPNVDSEIANTDATMSRILLHFRDVHRASVSRLPDIHLLKAVSRQTTRSPWRAARCLASVRFT